MGRHKRAEAVHDAEAGPMLAGGWRAECKCGWWTDHPDQPAAVVEARRHNRTATSCAQCAEWQSCNPVTAWPTVNAYLVALLVQHRQHREAAG